MRSSYNWKHVHLFKGYICNFPFTRQSKGSFSSKKSENLKKEESFRSLSSSPEKFPVYFTDISSLYLFLRVFVLYVYWFGIIDVDEDTDQEPVESEFRRRNPNSFSSVSSDHTSDSDRPCRVEKWSRFLM